MAAQAAEKEYKIKVKVNNNDDTRLWRYSQQNDYEGLCTFIRTTWNNDDFIAQYEDDEGDLITIASAQDLMDAFDFARDENKKSLKIFIQNYVKQKRAAKPSNPATETEQKQEVPAPPKQFNSIREMAFDFLSNRQIITLLPDFFGVLITKLIKKGNNMKVEEIINMIYTEINDARFNVITSHPLYVKYAALAIPYIANKIASQQSLYPHFRLETIKNWINQLIQILHQVLQQTANSGGCAFKDVVIDIEYPAMTDTGKVIHFGVECDLCGSYPIVGDRYKCSICPDWDCCTECEPKHDHPLIKFKKSSKNHQNAAFKGLAEIIGHLSGNNNNNKNDEQKSDDIDTDIVCDCICGAKMECIVARTAYNRCNSVYCDVCSAQLYNEMIFHCPNNYDPVHHKNGYDLCSKCAKQKVLDDKEKEKQMEEEEEEEEEEEGDEEEENNEEIPPKEEEFEYESQLNQIKQIMGLDGGDSVYEIIKALLIEHKGDITKVVPLLLQ